MLKRRLNNALLSFGFELLEEHIAPTSQIKTSSRRREQRGHRYPIKAVRKHKQTSTIRHIQVHVVEPNFN